MIIHFVLTKEDAEIICWKKSLPKRTFNKSVNEILSAERAGKTAHIPCEFSFTNEAEPVNGRLVIRDEKTIALIKSFPKGKATKTIKKIILKHIRKNKELPLPQVNLQILDRKLRNFSTKMTETEKLFNGTPDKHKKLCVCYEKAIKAFFDAVTVCYKTGDENLCDSKLLHLDCNKIINDVFAEVFQEIFVIKQREKSENEIRLIKILEYGLPDEELQEILRVLENR